MSKRVLRLLMENPQGMTQRDMLKRMRGTYQEVRVALEMLENAGLARCTKVGKAIRWYA